MTPICVGFLGHCLPDHAMTKTYWQVPLPPGVFKRIGNEKVPYEELCDACHRLWLARRNDVSVQDVEGAIDDESRRCGGGA